jgi:5-formyltetrahydrofolate cyclo-ligase
VDLVVYGSVAVSRQGARIGKGRGLSDLEFAFLVEAGVLRPDTILATTVRGYR